MRKNRKTHLMTGLFTVLFSLLFLLLAGRFIYIQASGVIDGVSLEEWAKEKRTASYTLDSERGKIFDKNGMTLAYDMPVYRMYAIIDESYSEGLEEPKHVVDPEKTASILAPILDVEESKILGPIQTGIKKDLFQVEFGNIGKNLSQNTKDKIEDLKLPGIYFQEDSLRHYPNGVFASHILGFAREAQVEDSEEQEIVGITGIEKEMNDVLKGVDGYISYQRDKYNKRLLDPNEIIKQPHDGNDVYLTIDQKIQTLVEDVLTEVEQKYDPERITAIVMDPKTGEILAMSNRPSYNPNNPANVENWYNDGISSPFEPGSTMKIFTWAAAIEEGVYNGDEGFQSGSYQVNEKIPPINDHNYGRGWGIISYDEGFVRSSNVAAAKLVWEKLGTEAFLEYLHSFDFDKETGIDLPGEIKGQILYNWPNEKLTTAFGQGTTLTPIQQMKAATAIANDGKMLQPYVIQKIVDPSTGEVIEEKEPNIVGQPISEETSNQVLKLMEAVVNDEKGTGQIYQLEDYTVGGKTGTAQIPDPNGRGYMTGANNYIFTFLGMAPIDDPELMMYVSIKQPKLNGEHSSVPVSYIFNNVMENSLHYLNIEPDKEDNQALQLTKVPAFMDKNTLEAKEILKQADLNPIVIGTGNKIVSANVAKGDEILPQEKILLITDEPTMPNVVGWSKRDVMQFAELANIKIDTIGSGFVVLQGIKEGAKLKENDYLVVELEEPDSVLENTDTEETEQEAEEE